MALKSFRQSNITRITKIYQIYVVSSAGLEAVMLMDHNEKLFIIKDIKINNDSCFSINPLSLNQPSFIQ